MENPSQKIQASTVTLLGPNSLLQKGHHYRIPVYQRPYSWDAEQIRRFFQTLIYNFRKEREMSFLGTVLLLPTEKTSDPLTWDVVDGQQRLTTFFFFFHYLKLRGSGNMLPRAMADNGWLKSEINGGEEQSAIDAAMALSFEDVKIERFPNDNNRYAYRLYLIGREFEDLWDDEFESLSAEERTEAKAAELLSDKALRDFLQYLGSEVSMVRIVTETGLAKTLDIFDTINTTGMALNGSDIFKIRMYEYLKDVKRWPTDPFKEIDQLYTKLEAENKRHALTTGDPNARICDMDQVLMLYQHSLIEVESINRATHGLAASTFWDRLFRTILFNEQVEGFRRDAPYRDKIGLEAMTRLIDARFAWEQSAVRTPRTHLMCRLMFYTRYGWRFWWLAVLYIDRFDGQTKGSGFDPKLLERFVELLTKYYAIQSIHYAKVVNVSITFTYDLIKIMLDPKETQQGLLWHLENAIQHAAAEREGLKSSLSGDLYWNYMLCRLVCTLAEFSNPGADLETEEGAKHFHENVFDGEFDLDHIFARAQFDVLADADRAPWNEVLNSIGNLTLFGRSENRSQGAYLYHEKRGNFHGSKYLSAREAGMHEAWTAEACAARRDLLVERVAGWLTGGDS